MYRKFRDRRYRINPSFFNGGKKPDLVGLTSTLDWVGVEAKGRTNNFSQYALDFAKNVQLANLRSNGKPVALKLATQSHFSNYVLSADLLDPFDTNDHAKNLDLPEAGEYVRFWFEPFMSLVEEGNVHSRQSETTYLFVDIPEVDIKVGIDKNVLSLVDGDTNSDQQALFQYVNTRTSHQGDKWFSRREGIIVEVGSLWNEQNLLREPTEREH